ncbi:MAG: PEP-utilizing enzyme [Patescibacteria group bacterium]
MEKISFHKTYTRDTSAIIQQAWFTALDKDTSNLDWKNPSWPPVIDYIHDGVIEIWENTAATQWFIDRLLKENTTNPHFLEEKLAEHEQLITMLRPFWKKESESNIRRFEKVVDSIFDGMFTFVVMYYTALDERTPHAIQENVLEMREKDVFFDESDRFIRKSLVTIYPELSGSETTVLHQEIENIPDKEIRLLRRQHFVFLGELLSAAMPLNEFVGKYPEYQPIEEAVPAGDSSTLKGQPAYSGFVKGKVRILKRKDQVSSVQEGEIIVSPMTTPDYLPGMKKAAAFVTDEGGIMCHAAITARELKKPCVVGTKFATQVLKDGDEVEVDADNGVVRILER